jgi:hypothetical protein
MVWGCQKDEWLNKVEHDCEQEWSSVGCDGFCWVILHYEIIRNKPPNIVVNQITPWNYAKYQTIV